jgi:hypothetical protein
MYVKPFLSVLRYTNSDYPFGIFKLFWLHKKMSIFILSILTWFIICIYYWNLQFLNKVLILKTKLFLQCQSKHRLLGRWYPWGLLFHQQQYHEENLCRQRRIAKFHSFGIFNLGSLRYIVSIKLCTRALVIYIREEQGFLTRAVDVVVIL